MGGGTRTIGEAWDWGGSHEMGALGFNNRGLGKNRTFGGIERRGGRGPSIVENNSWPQGWKWAAELCAVTSELKAREWTGSSCVRIYSCKIVQGLYE